MALTCYNFTAGFSGLQPIDSIFWLSYNLIVTTWQMGWTFLMDQDAPMACAARIVDKNPLLDDLKAKQPAQAKPRDNKVMQII